MSIEERQQLLKPFREYFTNLKNEHSDGIVTAIDTFAKLPAPKLEDLKKFNSDCQLYNELFPSEDLTYLPLNTKLIEMFRTLLQDQDCRTLMVQKIKKSDDKTKHHVYVQSSFIRNDIANEIRKANTELLDALFPYKADAPKDFQLLRTSSNIITKFDNDDDNPDFTQLQESLKVHYEVLLDNASPTLNENAHYYLKSCIRAFFRAFDIIGTLLSTGKFEAGVYKRGEDTFFKLPKFRHEISKERQPLVEGFIKKMDAQEPKDDENPSPS